MKEDAFDNIPLDEAIERWISEVDFRKAAPLKSPQAIAVEKSIGRVTAEPVLARISAPYYYSSVCDGICVKSSDTVTASADAPIRLKIGKDAYFVDTGSAMPTEFDAVLSIKDAQLQSLEELIIEGPITPWRNVRPIGEDMTVQEVILGAHKPISPLDIGALRAGGVCEVLVRKKPRAAIIPVGGNLIPPGEEPAVGKCIDYKSPMLLHLIENSLGDGKITGFVAERMEDIKNLFRKGLEKIDLIFIISGPSWGTALIKKLLIEIGELIIGSVTINPGSSICLGIIDGKPVIALPEHPVSIYLGYTLFGKPVIHKMLGLDHEMPHRIIASLGRGIESKKDYDEFIRVNLGEVNGTIVALPISKGDAVVMSLVKADGMLRVPSKCERKEPGDEVEIELMPQVKDIRKNILMTGSYDICIDVLKNQIEKNFPGLGLHSVNVGSREGLASLSRDLAHLCGIHAFDEHSGTYNVPLVKEFFPQTPLVLVNLFQRKIGLLTRKGNPKKIRGLQDIALPHVTFVSRQKGSGTRAILDYHCAQHAIPREKIRFYESEAKTPISLASIIASGLADAGLGILPAAKAFKLDFIPLFLESFDLVFLKPFLNTFVTQILLEVINGTSFRSELEHWGGYDLSSTGKVTFEQGGCRL
ncbi:MAG: substrate-binding domain-containing protein [Candidatus Eremiobacteraeota bacterium]|nr:substrate-binding domain-containing protein [Candidatus Eremiobacteraeota bacterium]